MAFRSWYFAPSRCCEANQPDGASIREITRGTLETFDYTVLTASDGTEALALYADKKKEIALVLGPCL